jgi:hypothetical protein
MARSGLEFLLSPSSKALFLFGRIHFLTLKVQPAAYWSQQKSQSILQFSPQSGCCREISISSFFQMALRRVYFWDRDAQLFVEMRIEKSPRETKHFHRLPLVEREKCWENIPSLIWNTFCDEFTWEGEDTYFASTCSQKQILGIFDWISFSTKNQKSADLEGKKIWICIKPIRKANFYLLCPGKYSFKLFLTDLCCRAPF